MVVNLEVRMSPNEWALYDGVRKEYVEANQDRS